MNMKFALCSRELRLQGNALLNRTIVSLRSIVKTTDVDFCGAVWAKREDDEAEGVEAQAVDVSSEGELQGVMSMYANVGIMIMRYTLRMDVGQSVSVPIGMRKIRRMRSKGWCVKC